MTELFQLLSQTPALSVTLGFALAAFLAWLFKDTIAEYIKKKYNLYNITEIQQAVMSIEDLDETVLPQRTSVTSRVILALTEPELIKNLN